jgi:hypothetical protein
MGDNRLEPLMLSEAERRTLENWAGQPPSAQVYPKSKYGSTR